MVLMKFSVHTAFCMRIRHVGPSKRLRRGLPVSQPARKAIDKRTTIKVNSCAEGSRATRRRTRTLEVATVVATAVQATRQAATTVWGCVGLGTLL